MIISAMGKREAVFDQKLLDYGSGTKVFAIPTFSPKIMTGNTNRSDALDRSRHALNRISFRSFDIHLQKRDFVDTEPFAKRVEGFRRHPNF